MRAVALLRAAAPARPPLSEASLRVGKLLILYEDGGAALRDAFDRFDASKDGEVSVAELHAGLVALGAAFENTTRDEVEKIAIDAFDTDADDPRFRFDDFTAFVRRARAQLADAGGADAK